MGRQGNCPAPKVWPSSATNGARHGGTEQLPGANRWVSGNRFGSMPMSRFYFTSFSGGTPTNQRVATNEITPAFKATWFGNVPASVDGQRQKSDGGGYMFK